MRTILEKKNNVREMTEKNSVKDWVVAYVKNALSKHRNKTPIDHPDGSVTTGKIADGAVTADKLDDDVVATDTEVTEMLNEIF